MLAGRGGGGGGKSSPSPVCEEVISSRLWNEEKKTVQLYFLLDIKILYQLSILRCLGISQPITPKIGEF